MFPPMTHWPDLDERLATLLPELIDVRRDLHQHPELGFEETRTQERVMQWLSDHGYEPRVCAQTGVVADLYPGEPPTLALRADIDALPIHETTDLPYRSVHDGVAHKCGHDGHATIMLGVAALLDEVKDTLGANVRLLFQPAEEGVRGGGAKVMVAEGVMDAVPEVYGLHNWPGMPKGCVQVKAGAVMAQVDNFTVNIEGVGGHGSQPDRCKDPIAAGAQIITAIQTVVSRNLGALEAGVVSVCSFQAGAANNVIPGTARLLGTIRTLDRSTRQTIHDSLSRVVEGVGQAMSVRADLEIQPHYPALINHEGCVEAVARVAARVLPDLQVREDLLPLFASEDFAYFAELAPAAYFFLGAGIASKETPGCHHPDFDFDDDLISQGVRMFLGLVEDRLLRTA